jgi:hypothetical protein
MHGRARSGNLIQRRLAACRAPDVLRDEAGARRQRPVRPARHVRRHQHVGQFIVNWEATAAAFIQRLHRDLLRTADAETRRLLDELLACPDVPRHWRMLDVDASTVPYLAIELRRDDTRFSFFTILASLGTPCDITLHELRVECFFPADGATEEALRRLADGR